LKWGPLRSTTKVRSKNCGKGEGKLGRKGRSRYWNQARRGGRGKETKIEEPKKKGTGKEGEGKNHNTGWRREKESGQQKREKRRLAAPK